MARICFLCRIFASVVPIILFFPLSSSAAGGWSVEPTRIDFDRQAKSAAVTVTNETERKLHIQIKAMAWNQDEKGQDQHADTTDIIYFPRMTTLNAGEARIIRVGTKMAPVLKERAYRLFVEELSLADEQEKKKEETKRAQISLALRYSIPIFIRPVKVESLGVIEKIEMTGGKIHVAFKNAGTVSFKILAITLKGRGRDGQELFTKDLAGWYLLSGVSRVYETVLTGKECRDISELRIEVATDKFRIEGRLDVDQAMCKP